MSELLSVKSLSKEYPKFKLQDVSFKMESGRIMGFIGRNGAGKSTTLKSILNIVHPLSGEIKYFGMDMKGNEAAVKQRVGFAGGAIDYYKKKRLSDILNITKTFYDNWDDESCKHYMEAFSLDYDKTPSELSEGMKVKFNLTMALSHKAELLILDEPTSGLDPISRDELLEIFKLLKKRGISILFSTHITSDLDKCADDITYIRGGQILFTGTMADFSSQNDGKTLEDIMLAHEKEVLYEKLGD